MQTKINWFEIPSTDFARAVKFYETIFDAKLKVDDLGNMPLGIFVDDKGESVGCVVHSEHMKPSEQGALLYLDATPDFDAVLDRVTKAGGRIVMGKLELPRELGYIAQFIDTEGNRVALHAEH